MNRVDENSGGRDQLKLDDTRPDLAVIDASIITMDRDRAILEGGGLAIKHGRIVAIDASAEISRLEANDVINAGGALIHPGFIDTHTHVSLHLGRSTLPDTWDFNREHERYVPYARALDQESEYLAAMLAFTEMALHGTTTFCDLGGRHFDQRLRAGKQVGLRGFMCDVVWDNPPDPRLSTGGFSDCIARLESSLRSHKTDAGLINPGVGLPGRGSCSTELVEEAKRLATAHNVPFYIHELFEPSPSPGGNLAVWERAGVLDEATLLIHMIHVTKPDVSLLGATGANIVHCPASAMRAGQDLIGSTLFPEMMQAGINISLGSDAGNFSDVLDLGLQMYLTAIVHNDHGARPGPINAETVLGMATINAAAALGIDHLVGSLEVGKRADIVIRDSTRPESYPMLDVATNLLYTLPGLPVKHSIIDGRPVIRDGTFVEIDQVGLYQEVSAKARAIHRNSDIALDHRWPTKPAGSSSWKVPPSTG